MTYGFDDNKGKVDIDAILSNLQTTYQGNINTIYNAITAQGTTPAGKSPSQLAAGISTMATAKYNAGYSAGNTAGYNSGYSAGYSAGDSAGYTRGYNAGKAAAEGVKWTTRMSAGALSTRFCQLDITTITHVESVRNVTGVTLDYECYNASGGVTGSGTVANGGYVTIPANTVEIKLMRDSSSATSMDISADVVFKAGAVR